MTLIGGYAYYAFWAGAIIYGAFMLWRIDRTLRAIYELWKRP